MSKKPLIKDETPLRFFELVKVPESWRFIEKESFQHAAVKGYWSYGYWYWIADRIKVRVFFIYPCCRGGLLEVDMHYNPPKIITLCSNKQSDGINEFIEAHYGTPITI